jgi:hypothetical protein
MAPYILDSHKVYYGIFISLIRSDVYLELLPTQIRIGRHPAQTEPGSNPAANRRGLVRLAVLASILPRPADAAISRAREIADDRAASGPYRLASQEQEVSREKMDELFTTHAS